MGANSVINLSSPEESVGNFFKGWRDNDPRLQWQTLFKHTGDKIRYYVSSKDWEEWDFQKFEEEFPRLRNRFYLKYALKYLSAKGVKPDKAIVLYLARNNGSKRKFLPFLLSKSRWLSARFYELFNIGPWHDVTVRFDVFKDGGQWKIGYWKYIGW